MSEKPPVPPQPSMPKINMQTAITLAVIAHSIPVLVFFFFMWRDLGEPNREFTFFMEMAHSKAIETNDVIDPAKNRKVWDNSSPTRDFWADQPDIEEPLPFANNLYQLATRPAPVGTAYRSEFLPPSGKYAHQKIEPLQNALNQGRFRWLERHGFVDESDAKDIEVPANRPDLSWTAMFDEKTGAVKDRVAVARATKLFENSCGGCHSRNAEGGAPVSSKGIAAPTLVDGTILEKNDGYTYWTIVHGRNTMPAHGDRVKPDDRWRIVAYIRARQKGLIDADNKIASENKKSAEKKSAA